MDSYHFLCTPYPTTHTSIRRTLEENKEIKIGKRKDQYSLVCKNVSKLVGTNICLQWNHGTLGMAT